MKSFYDLVRAISSSFVELFSIPERFQENFRKFLTSDEIGV